MSRWSLEFSTEAERDLVRLDQPVRKRVIEKSDWFLDNFASVFPIPLTGEYREFYKLRVGDWRIFYSIKWTTRIIRVEYIEHRNKAYRKRK